MTDEPPRDPFADDVLERLAKSNHGYQRAHGHYIVPLAERLLEARASLREIVDAAEALTRPGSAGHEHVNAARMTNALQAGATLIDHRGIFPELTT